MSYVRATFCACSFHFERHSEWTGARWARLGEFRRRIKRPDGENRTLKNDHDDDHDDNDDHDECYEFDIDFFFLDAFCNIEFDALN